MVTKKMLVLNKDHKSIGTKEITITRDLMCYRNGDYLVIVAPVVYKLSKEVDHDHRRSY